MEEEKEIYCPDTKTWRAWLKKHHLKEKYIAIIRYKKHTGKPSPSHHELMREAICFGWIDTTVKRIDDEKYKVRFARRNDKSKWSDNTLRYAKELLAEGKMSPEGIKRYEEGKSRPTHDHGIPKDPKVPGDLKKALAQDNKAREGFDAFPPSSRRMYLRWMERAKLPETRVKRIQSIVTRARLGNKKL